MYSFVLQMEFKDFDINKVKSAEKKTKVLSVRATKGNFEWIKRIEFLLQNYSIMYYTG